MDNWTITQEILCRKLIQYTSKNGSPEIAGTYPPSDSQNYLNDAYYFLNQAIDSQTVTSIGLVSSKRKGILRKGVIFIKKAMRKLLFWYIEPICRAQTHYNEMNTQFDIKMFYQMQKNIGSLEAYANEMTSLIEEKVNALSDDAKDKALQNETLQNEISALVKRADEYSRKADTFSRQNEALQNEINMLVKRMDEHSWKLGMLSDQNEKLQKENWTLLQDIERCRQETEHCRRETEHCCQETGKALDFIRQGGEPHHRDKSGDFWIKTTVAQSGEDSIIAYILMVLGIHLQDEFYLDLGANHAKQLSNTYMLYVNGMRGVLVEANPELIPELKFFRNEDILLNKCVSAQKGGPATFYILSGDGLSTTSWEDAQETMRINPAITLKETISIESITVNEILDKYFAKPPLVLNIDIEGMEEEILTSYDYEHYAPLIVIVERIEYSTSLSLVKRADNIAEILSQHGYLEYAYTGINSIYINKARMEEFAYADRI